MAKFVIKRDGRKVPFDQEKLKAGINAAAYESELSFDESQSVASDVTEAVLIAFQGQEEVSSDAIKDRILEELDEKHPAVANTWRKYEEGKE